jgi:hypothetical protein
MVAGMVVMLWSVVSVEVKGSVVFPALTEPVKVTEAVITKVPLELPVTMNVLPNFWNVEESYAQ